MSDIFEDWISTDEAMLLLGTHRNTLLQKKDQIEHRRVGRTLLFKKVELLKYFEANPIKKRATKSDTTNTTQEAPKQDITSDVQAALELIFEGLDKIEKRIKDTEAQLKAIDAKCGSTNTSVCDQARIQKGQTNLLRQIQDKLAKLQEDVTDLKKPQTVIHKREWGTKRDAAN